MENWIFIASLALIISALFAWAFRTLPQEGWQILAAVPVEKTGTGWRGVNLTWYGFFLSSAMSMALLVFFILLGSLGVSLHSMLLLSCSILLVCLPAARIVAWMVEGKRHTFTVGGAAFLGILLTPWVVYLLRSLNLLPQSAPVIAVLAAGGIAYAIGEGVGRLACISFGCCYGKPLDQCPVWLKTLLGGKGFVFHGATRKIAYAHGLEGKPVAPVQAMTAVVCFLSAMLALILFLNGYSGWAFVISMVATQLWRSFSEFLRADYRGDQKISAYQIMGAAAALYAVCIALILPGKHAALNVMPGIISLWSPAAILFVQGLWIAVFMYTGRSTVTGAYLRFHVNHERV